MLLFQLHSTAKLLQVDRKKIQTRDQLVYASSIGKNRVNIGYVLIWEEDFAFHIFNMAQNIKWHWLPGSMSKEKWESQQKNKWKFTNTQKVSIKMW